MRVAAIRSLLIVTVVAAVVVEAAEPSGRVDTFMLENDVIASTDDHYTNGIRVASIFPDVDPTLPTARRFLRSPALWLGNIGRRRGIGRLGLDCPQECSANVGLALGQNMYTPPDISVTTEDPLDRPYGGWAYVGGIAAWKDKTRLWQVEIDVGATGSASGAERVQTEFHRLIDSGLPKGWDHQIPARAGLLIDIVHKQRILERTARSRLGDFSFDVIPHGGLVVGNIFDYAHAGGTMRFGRNMPSNFGVGRVISIPAPLSGDENSTPVTPPPTVTEDPFAQSGSVPPSSVAPEPSRPAVVVPVEPRREGRRPRTEAWVFVGVDSRLVVHNVFLDGIGGRPHSVDKRNNVTDLEAGFAIRVNQLRFTYKFVDRTPEMRTESRHHRFGSFAITFDRNFW